MTALTVTEPQRNTIRDLRDALARGSSHAARASLGVPSPPVDPIDPVTDEAVWARTLQGMEDAVYTVLVDSPQVRPPVVLEWLSNRPEYGETVEEDWHVVVHSRSDEDRQHAVTARARRRADVERHGEPSRAITFVRRLLGHRDV